MPSDGIIRFALRVRNETPARLARAGVDLFEPKLNQKDFEIERESFCRADLSSPRERICPRP